MTTYRTRNDGSQTVSEEFHNDEQNLDIEVFAHGAVVINVDLNILAHESDGNIELDARLMEQIIAAWQGKGAGK